MKTTVEDLIVYGKQHINSMHAKMLLADILKVNTLALYTMLDKEVAPADIALYKKEIEALKQEQPLQYVIGSVNFYGEKFSVNNNVLIPRFETEELVEYIVQYLRQYPTKHFKILDLGCGSGVIGLTLKQLFPDRVEVTLVDISEKALDVTKENAQKQHLEARFIKSNWFEQLEEESYDIIVSNPPYLKPTEQIDPLVKNNEPALALYGGTDGLASYQEIIKNSAAYLTPSSLLAFEIGQDQADEISNIIYRYFPDAIIDVKKDLQGRNRMIFVRFSTD